MPDMLADPRGALAGLRVVDLTRVLGGPYGTQILGDHGADVIKVEPPQGDETRGWGPPFQDGTAAYFMGTNRNKRGIVLDLSGEADRAVLLGLLAGADVLVENFKPGTLEKWGLGYADILEDRFPRLIHCRVSGFGTDGPLGGMPGYDAAVQALTGMMSVNGTPDGDPTRMGIPVVDLVTGLNAVIGILLALRERETSGRGQSIDVSLFDCALSVMHPHVANYLHSGQEPRRTGNAHPNIAPYDSFATATDSVFLAVGNDGQFDKLCRMVDRPELARDARFASNAARSLNRDALKAELEEALAVRDGRALVEKLTRAGVPCAPVLSLGAALEHPHTRHRGMIVEIGDYRGCASPIKLSRSPAGYRRPPPGFGAHNGDVLDELKTTAQRDWSGE